MSTTSKRPEQPFLCYLLSEFRSKTRDRDRGRNERVALARQGLARLIDKVLLSRVRNVVEHADDCRHARNNRLRCLESDDHFEEAKRGRMLKGKQGTVKTTVEDGLTVLYLGSLKERSRKSGLGSLSLFTKTISKRGNIADKRETSNVLG
jgi:hypothetical protein